MTQLALKIAKEEGVTTILNPSPAVDLPQSVYDNVDIICLNEIELEQLSGLKADTLENIITASKHLIAEKGIKHVIVTLGGDGCLSVTAEGVIHQPIETKPEKVVDTTGAGDCFLGTFAHYYSKGHDITTCLKEANKCASYSVGHKGTQTSYPRNKLH